jgi:hypothetical protein
MAQTAIVGAEQVDTTFPAGTQAVGFHRFTMQLPPGPVETHLPTVDSTTFGPISTPGTYTFTYATIGVDAVTVLGPVITTTAAIGAQVQIRVAAGITVSFETIP